MKKVMLFDVKSRLALAVIFVVMSPVSIPYVLSGLIVKEKLSVREKITLYSLLTVYFGSCFAINLAGCSGMKVFWVVTGCVIIASFTREVIEEIRERRKCEGEDID